MFQSFLLVQCVCSTHISSTESFLALSLVPVGSTQWQELYELSYKEQEARVPILWPGGSSSVLSWCRPVSTALRPFEEVAALSCH